MDHFDIPDSPKSCQEDDKPPALPEKTRAKSVRRYPSQYDNVSETVENNHEKTCALSHTEVDDIVSLKQESSASHTTLTVENSSGII